MSTPKDVLYKQRQVEFRKLNKRKLRADVHGQVSLETITHKNTYPGNKGK